jgi:hypothetical protein
MSCSEPPRTPAQKLRDVGVAGSNPVIPTKKNSQLPCANTCHGRTEGISKSTASPPDLVCRQLGRRIQFVTATADRSKCIHASCSAKNNQLQAAFGKSRRLATNHEVGSSNLCLCHHSPERVAALDAIAPDPISHPLHGLDAPASISNVRQRLYSSCFGRIAKRREGKGLIGES